jgi:hypothetical protein
MTSLGTCVLLICVFPMAQFAFPYTYFGNRNRLYVYI